MGRQNQRHHKNHRQCECSPGILVRRCCAHRLTRLQRRASRLRTMLIMHMTSVHRFEGLSAKGANFYTDAGSVMESCVFENRFTRQQTFVFIKMLLRTFLIGWILVVATKSAAAQTDPV